MKFNILKLNELTAKLNVSAWISQFSCIGKQLKRIFFCNLTNWIFVFFFPQTKVNLKQKPIEQERKWRNIGFTIDVTLYEIN